MNWVIEVAAAVSVAGVQAPQNDLRLTSQRAEGLRRICVYGVGVEAKARRIGLGEPCPFRYRVPQRESRRVPSMAIRIGEERSNGRRICLYRHAGQVYRAALPSLMSCPLTPSAAMEALSPPSAAAGSRR